MDVSKITLAEINRNGLLYTICEKIGLSQLHNQAMTIANLADKYNCNPIEFVNKIKYK
jgi:hypothetical protein